MRTTNQDFVELFYNQADQLLAILCDGMGGHKAGDIASEMAVMQLGHRWKETSFSRSSDVKEWLDRQINIENKRIYRVARTYNDLQGMGTTLVTAAFIDETIVIGNIGDSRAYQLNANGDMCQITVDHSFANELRMSGEITEEEARTHHQRHTLTRSLGVFDKVMIDFFELKIEETQLILLCSDGLSNGVDRKEMNNIVQNELSLSSKAEALIAASLKNGSTDNITVCLIDLTEQSLNVRRGA